MSVVPRRVHIKLLYYLVSTCTAGALCTSALFIYYYTVACVCMYICTYVTCMYMFGLIHASTCTVYMYVYMYMYFRGSLHTSQISHLLLYPSLWLLVPRLSSQFFRIQPAFNASSGHAAISLRNATRFCKLLEPLYTHTYM